MLKTLHNYQAGELKMNERNRAKLLELTGACIGEIDTIHKILSFKNNVVEINNSIQEIVQNMYDFKDPHLLRFCTRGMLRLQASKSSKLVPLYNEWFKTYYKL